MSKPTGKIRFSSYHLPVLEDGFYEVTVGQDFQASSESEAVAAPEVKRVFAVQGPRFRLDPSEVIQQFPPAKTSGEYFSVLPHVLFKRSILPWERQVGRSIASPWLALVGITEQEQSRWQQVSADKNLLALQHGKLAEVCASAKARGILFPDLHEIELGVGETHEELLTYIDIPEPLVKLLLPTKEELSLLASIRQSADGPDSPKFPTVLCNRLPRPGQANQLYLLSLEGRTDVYEHLEKAPTLRTLPTASADCKHYRFVVLHNWKFASVALKQTFSQLLTDAHGRTAESKHLFRLSQVGKPQVDVFLEAGYVPLPHQTRQGNRMVSWYRGPLVPHSQAPARRVPVASADSLLRVFRESGMFDVSLASAWNLGRLLLLQNKQISSSLFEWKRACTQESAANLPGHLPGKRRNHPVLPSEVEQWFGRLSRLAEIPFAYLVPDPNLVPAESMHFFFVDPNWLDCLRRGAFALGDLALRNPKLEDDLYRQLPCIPELTGVLLRSQLVSGWPHLVVEGFPSVSPGEAALPCHRSALGPDTLLVLFEGRVQSVEFSLLPEAIHFGVEYFATDPSNGVPSECTIKRLRDSNGEVKDPAHSPCGQDRSQGYAAGEWVRVPYRLEGSGVIDIQELANRLNKASSTSLPVSGAGFAFQMIEGVPKVRFVHHSGVH